MITTEREITEETFRHTLPIQIRFNDVDSIGHINNNIYFSYFDLGKINYFENLKASYVSWIDGIIVIARIEVDFIAPVFYKEDIVVDTKIVRVGNKSVTLLQQIRNSLTNEIKCRCNSVVVTYNPKELVAMKVPQIWKESIIDYEGLDIK
ncbi:acyl-CoA thioesterase [Dysgonomonas macrotermitis]|uniref:Acyl-CoA thioester hydrolase n=1 Tax=Dysgonomonas macrotermitis TaxID=1346286 RepID=A0A1M4ZMY0_9BACT|nr:thioesterase family protein [Dysgonomonas macrotermitis]SHF19460.1 acyl-CoA thioester hydrolase [Dysgonomonas macrotermitis]